ncbi:hypothetical protein JYQ62_18265 [Nostoc sp. UHCC 0702]|nr:hypothetical protein JYQ62_18265 [Nostoc sp. UHCC 0702]
MGRNNYSFPTSRLPFRQQGSRGAGEQGSRGAGEQGSRGAGEQGSRGEKFASVILQREGSNAQSPVPSP